MTDEYMLDIAGLDKARLLQVFYNRATPFNAGYIQYKPEPLSYERAQEMIERLLAGKGAVDDHWHQGYQGKLIFDYLIGRCMKINLSNDKFNCYAFDQTYGHGVSAVLIENVRAMVSEVA